VCDFLFLFAPIFGWQIVSSARQRRRFSSLKHIGRGCWRNFVEENVAGENQTSLFSGRHGNLQADAVGAANGGDCSRRLQGLRGPPRTRPLRHLLCHRLVSLVLLCKKKKQWFTYCTFLDVISENPVYTQLLWVYISFCLYFGHRCARSDGQRGWPTKIGLPVPKIRKFWNNFSYLVRGTKYPFCHSDAHLRRNFFNLCLKTVFFYVFSSKFLINLPKIADQYPFSGPIPPLPPMRMYDFGNWYLLTNLFLVFNPNFYVYTDFSQFWYFIAIGRFSSGELLI